MLCWKHSQTKWYWYLSYKLIRYDSDESSSSRVINDPEFCNIVSTLDKSDGEEDSTPTEAPGLTPTTGELTKQAIPGNDATIKTILTIEFND